MFPNWLGLICATFALLAFFVSYGAAKRIPVKKRVVWTLTTLVLALPGASFAAYYAHVVEVPAWYYEFRSWPRIEACLILIGIAGGVVASLVGPISRILSLLLVVLFVTVPFVKPFLGPFHEGALRDQWDGKVCRQSTYSTCGAASTASLLRHHGIIVTEAVIAEEAHSYTSGTEAWYLARAIRQRGLQVKFQLSTDEPLFLSATPVMEPRESKNDPTVAMVGVRFGNTGHFIALLGEDKTGKLVVGDPLRGRELLSREELRQRYVFTGFSMQVF
ncbi:cysteine peptidase family C39 domain-containing protein [Prosthecobacter dejongeii]|uniref:Peptidase C39 domain-containing protein n=1 Tax=Prosthecobacter dejongeii TaxID=48465 RepID=A0A7W7YNJ9_9BACT|nr:cysteine peptidase family C39 domain-containing protein [Prosthecobacter dejongeii]MBB5039225.1 hypothetical protein [Prosthecobacter dejongeii]